MVKFQQERINFVCKFVYFVSQLNCQEAMKSVSGFLIITCLNSLCLREACQPEGIDSRFVEIFNFK